MESLINFYQHLPTYINPVIFTLGPISMRWYALSYILAFLTIYLLLLYRIKKDECLIFKQFLGKKSSKEIILNLIFYGVAGTLIGGRIGYAFFYNPSYYLERPLEIFLPFQIFNNNWVLTGYYGMSYFGGLIGIIFAGLLFVRVYRINFWKLANFVIPAVPAGYFWGRIGNFLNGELYGRATDKFWGMYFSQDSFGFLRHPSQLYEAFFEGLVLFAILWSLRNNKKNFISRFLFPIYLLGYGLCRFFIEFLREPDFQNGFFLNFFSLGQIFSLGIILIALLLIVIFKRKILKIC